MNRIWYSQHPLAYLLLPFSAIFFLCVALRRFLFRHKLIKSTKFSVPVIIVGNITVGGTGKTPLTIWLTNFLKQQGYHPGIVSRGYGGKAKNYPQWVNQDSNPELVGDEAVLLAQKTLCPVVVAPDRVLAVKTLLEKSNCNMIISDDGLQHYYLARDIEIAVLDGERRLGNGFCLPAGPLRESGRRLADVDFIVTNGEARVGEYAMHLVPGNIYNLNKPEIILNQEIAKKHSVHAVAAIGNPKRFFNSLIELGFNIIEHPFPDHYLYQKSDFEFGKNALIIMTEKDAVKCKVFADERFWCLPIVSQLDSQLSEKLLKKLQKTPQQNKKNKSAKINRYANKGDCYG